MAVVEDRYGALVERRPQRPDKCRARRRWRAGGKITRHVGRDVDAHNELALERDSHLVLAAARDVRRRQRRPEAHRDALAEPRRDAREPVDVAALVHRREVADDRASLRTEGRLQLSRRILARVEHEVFGAAARVPSDLSQIFERDRHGAVHHGSLPPSLGVARQPIAGHAARVAEHMLKGAEPHACGVQRRSTDDIDHF